MKSLNYLIGHIFRYSRLLWIYLKKHAEKIGNSSIIIYVIKIENRVTFKINTGYYLNFLMPETMKLLGSINSMTTKENKW